MPDIDLTNSIFKIDPGLEREEDEWRERVMKWRRNLLKDKAKRVQNNNIRRDFFEGNQSKYTNIVGETKTEKDGHANAVHNLVRKFTTRMLFSMGNNSPQFIFRPLSKNDIKEAMRTQATEDFIAQVFWQNKFWTRSWLRSIQNQINYARFAYVSYPDFTRNMIRIEHIENINNLMIGWQGNNTEYDYTIYEEDRTVYSIQEDYGIKVKPKSQRTEESTSSGHEDPYREQTSSKRSNNRLDLNELEELDTPMATETQVWTPKYNILLINDHVVQLYKHDWGFNPVRVGGNIPNVGKREDISDIDDWIDPQIEFNQMRNDDRDFLRTAVNRKYRAHNMDDFDPQSLKTGSGQVIFTNNDEDFQAVQDHVNTFPIDQAMRDTKEIMHLLGVPEIVLGQGISSGVSGRAMAVGFNPYAELIVAKNKQQFDVLSDVCNDIQFFGHEYFKPKQGTNFFLGPENVFEPRPVEMKFEETVPTTREDKQVGILNKKNARMISLRTAIEELGYTDPDAEIEKLKKEWADPELAPILANKTEILEGVIKAAVKAQLEQSEAMKQNTEQEPTLLQDQNQDLAQPMAQPGVGGRFATPAGRNANVAQNENA